jgi:hypothetical protein
MRQAFAKYSSCPLLDMHDAAGSRRSGDLTAAGNACGVRVQNKTCLLSASEHLALRLELRISLVKSHLTAQLVDS